jgi:hypothetical protein
LGRAGPLVGFFFKVGLLSLRFECADLLEGYTRHRPQGSLLIPSPEEPKGKAILHASSSQNMSRGIRIVDLTQVPAVPWAWVDEHVYAAIRGCSVRVLQRERRLNIGCPFRRINGTTIRYKFGDITAFIESQPGGGDTEASREPRPGRPRRISP